MSRTSRLTSRAILVAMAVAWLTVPPAAGAAESDEARASIDLTAIERIHVPADQTNAERNAARIVQSGMKRLYEIEPDIVEGLPEGEAGPGVYVGRAAVAAGIITQAELDAVKLDGYVLRAAADRIGFSGYDAPGTIYAAYDLLRRLGLRLYPWWFGGDGGAAEVLDPLPGKKLPAFELSTRPFFEHRDLIAHLDRGRWRATMRQYRLGNPQQAANQDLFGSNREPGYTKYEFDRGDWTDWCHTAAYLIPRDLYYETHPEYFAIRNGKRIPPRRYARSQICTTHPDVVRISIERMLEWIEIQKDRRIFCVIPADTSMCECERCRAMDPIPSYSTDRVFTWVNAVAEAVAKKYPDKLILTGAYADYVKPPLRVDPAPNVSIFYAPWFWNSRTTSAVSFDHPLNVTAMKELMTWCMRYPGQIALYDYPGSLGYGAALRTKLYARHGVRVIYYNGARGSEMQWMASRITWDPFLDPEVLEEEFVKGYYGPAAGPMLKYYRLRQRMIERWGTHHRAVFVQRRSMPPAAPPEYYAKAWELLDAAAKASKSGGDSLRGRVLGKAVVGMREVLSATHPAKGALGARVSAEVYAQRAKRFVRLSGEYIDLCKTHEWRGLTRRAEQAYERAAKGLGIATPEKDRKDEEPGKEKPAEKSGEVFDRTIANIEDMAEQWEAAPPEAEPKNVSMSFAGDEEAGKWLSDATVAELLSPAEAADVATPGGTKLRGIRIKAPMSKLPEIAVGKIRMHAGRFYAERTLDKPLDATGCHSISLHVWSSADVPAIVYINGLQASFHLHAGEQIVRMDLRNFPDRWVDWRKWKGVESVAIDLWPQDNYYPYPEARDVEVVLVGLTASNRPPAVEKLPQRGKAVWLSRFRPNIPIGTGIPNEQIDYLKRTRQRHPSPDMGVRYRKENFRTFTPHRGLSPVYAIVTSPDASDAEMSAAGTLRDMLEKETGVRLPINPEGVAPGPDLGNVILLGEAAKAAERVTKLELDYVGPEGFVINAWQGRIAIAGQGERGTARGVARYLEDHGARFYRPLSPRGIDPVKGMLHELYVPEKPWFGDRPVAGGWMLRTDRPAERIDVLIGDRAEVMRMAEAIKDAAREDGKAVPESALAPAGKSALGRYVAAKLLWDPMADATRMVREFVHDAQDLK